MGPGLFPHPGRAPFAVTPALYGSLDRVAIYTAGILSSAGSETDLITIELA